VTTTIASREPYLVDWQKFGLICSSVDYLIDDAEAPFSPIRYVGLSGEIKPKKPEGKSKFAARNGSVFHTLMSPGIIDILPNADDLGSSRDERLSNLRTSCASLPAFNWVTQQHGFHAAISTMKKLGKQHKVPEYLVDTMDFKLMHVVASPADLYLTFASTGVVRKYPGRRELQDLSASAEKILNALRTKQFLPKIEVSPYLRNALASFKQEVDSKSPGWTRPHEDAGLNEAKFQYQVIENCLVTFKRCSPTVVQHISSMFGIVVDDSKVRARVKEVTANHDKTPKNGHFFT
jgi:hypothetical protein